MANKGKRFRTDAGELSAVVVPTDSVEDLRKCMCCTGFVSPGEYIPAVYMCTYCYDYCDGACTKGEN